MSVPYCSCEVCTSWIKEARGYKGNPHCQNPHGHCACCEDGHMSCYTCNHWEIALDDYKRIHFNATVDETDEDRSWVLLDMMEIS